MKLDVIVNVNTQRGLSELYERFRSDEFTGVPLRDVMIEVIGGPNKPKPGWQASIAFNRLIKSGMVKRVVEVPDARASWGHVYQITNQGLAGLGVGEEDPDLDLQRAGKLARRLRDKPVRITSKFINDPNNREALRLAVGLGWVQLVASLTPEGVESVGQLSEVGEM
jgi:hypothetical protein